VIFSDIDGSILDEKYEFRNIEPILWRLLASDVSIVLTSSKTTSEIEYYQKKWQICDPFISENGSAIVIPPHYFESSKKTERPSVIELGINYTIIREKLAIIKKQTGAEIVGFGDMTVEQISQDSALPLDLAVLAKERKYSEPFRILHGKKTAVFKAMLENGLSFTKGGRYLTALGNTDKGKAVLILKNLYLKNFEKIFTLGVGDSDNDFSLLTATDKSFYIRTPALIEPIWKEILEFVESYSLK
jgi:mannosyl-3-phosphoglycerate phosphatase